MRRPDSPEQLIDAVITDLRRKLTEARLQMLAANVARKKLTDPSEVDDQSHEAARQGIAKLEATLQELESRRNMLIAKARDAGARLAIERALMEVGSEPGQVALDLIAERASESEAEADATAEIRQISEGTSGDQNA
jgi:phage shock protein A